MRNLFTKLKELVDKSIMDFSENNSSLIKNDGSLVTDLDIFLDKEIIKIYMDLKPRNPVIISEESYSGNQNEIFDLTNRDFLIVDPIDGTENFNYFSFMYGVAVSGRINGVDFDFLYTPFDGKLICGIDDIYRHEITSNVKFFSTATINNLSKLSSKESGQIRVLGSSSTMFSLLLRGKACSYNYSSGCKIWDCFTGLRLANLTDNFIFKNVNDDWFNTPSFITNFSIKRKQ